MTAPLHVLGASPFAGADAADGLELAAAGGGAVILVGDGTLALLAPPAALAALADDGRLFVLGEDAIRRGVPADSLAGAQAVDYPGFVALAVRHHPVISWY